MPETLEYGRPPTPPGPRRLYNRAVAGAAMGMLLSAIINFPLPSAWVPFCGGPGDGRLAKLLYPFAMLAAFFPVGKPAAGMCIGLLQFPAYGAVCAVSAMRRRLWRTILVLVAAHAMAAALCLAFLPR